MTVTEPRPHLTLLDLSDRELLLVLRDVRDAHSGYAHAADIADRLDLGEEGRRSVSVRLSWLVRYGAVEREHKRDDSGNIRYHANGKIMNAQGWALTDIGFAMATGELKKSQQTTFERLGDGQMLMAMRWLSQRVVSSDPTVSRLMDREYRHGVGRR